VIIFISVILTISVTVFRFSRSACSAVGKCIFDEAIIFNPGLLEESQRYLRRQKMILTASERFRPFSNRDVMHNAVCNAEDHTCKSKYITPCLGTESLDEATEESEMAFVKVQLRIVYCFSIGYQKKAKAHLSR
jgi:hypothetical protein